MDVFIYQQLAINKDVHLLDTYKITALIVVDKDDEVIGALNIHDLLRAGIM